MSWLSSAWHWTYPYISDKAYWESAGKIAPVLTAVMAGVAVAVAYRALRVQRDVARKRAALDFFFKTEMDSSIVKQYNDFETAIGKLRNNQKTIEEMYNDKDETDYRAIRAYLNIHELVAVGVNRRVLDYKVCYDYWSDELMDAWRDGKELIKFLRDHPDGSAFTYIDLEKLNAKWAKKNERDHKKLGARIQLPAKSHTRPNDHG